MEQGTTARGAEYQNYLSVASCPCHGEAVGIVIAIPQDSVAWRCWELRLPVVTVAVTAVTTGRPFQIESRPTVQSSTRQLPPTGVQRKSPMFGSITPPLLRSRPSQSPTQSSQSAQLTATTLHDGARDGNSHFDMKCLQLPSRYTAIGEGRGALQRKSFDFREILDKGFTCQQTHHRALVRPMVLPSEPKKKLRYVSPSSPF